MKKFLLLVAMIATFIGVSAQNPYAYKLSTSDASDASITLHYSLNAPAVAVQLQIFDGETAVATIDVPETMIGKGDHEYIVNFADYPAIPTGKELTWKVQVTGASVEAPVQLTDNVLKFYSPAGVAVDVNPESDNFGTMYITESFFTQAKFESGNYYSCSNQSVGVGLYVFDPQFNGVKNADDKYGFSCGLQSAGYTNADWRPGRIQISEDGRMFIMSTRVNTGNPIYEINRETLAATPLFAGTLDTSTGIVTNGETVVAAGAGVAFDVIGSGENLKLMMMTCTPATTVAVANYKTNEYNLGTATSWGEAPSRNFTAFDNKAINYAGINLAYDGAGGIWFSQYRGTPTEGEPTFMHADLATDVRDVLDYSVVCRNGGMAFNKNHTMMVRCEATSKKIAVYSVENGAITKLYEYSCPSFTGFNQFAFDYANNIIACDNGAEVFGMIQLPNAAPVVTPAAAKYCFTVPGDEPIEHVYSVTGTPAALFGLENPWDPENAPNMQMNDNNLYEWTSAETKLDANTQVEFKVIQDHGWDVAFPEQNVVKTAEEAGVYTLNVTYNPETNEVVGTLTMKEVPVEHVYSVTGTPAALFGLENPWDPENAPNMQMNDNNLYEWTSAETKLDANTQVEFKVIQDHGWDVAFPEQNVVKTAEKKGIYKLNVTYNPETNEVVGTLTLVEEIVEYGEFYLVGTFSDPAWSQDEDARIPFTANDDGSEYSVTVNLAAGDQFKIITFVDDELIWIGAESDGNFVVLPGFYEEHVPINLIFGEDGENFEMQEGGKYKITLMHDDILDSEGIAPKALLAPFVMIIDKPTGIETINSDKKVDNAWYNMNGIRFENKPSVPGIYIHNGQKMIIK